MANHKSALKKAKQDIKRRAHNRAGRSRLRTALKKYRAQLADANANPQEDLSQLISLIDTSAKQGYIHKNAANRLKSRMSRQTAQHG